MKDVSRPLQMPIVGGRC